MDTPIKIEQTRKQLKRLVVLIMVGLALSGLTAFPIQWAFDQLLPIVHSIGPGFPFYKWLMYVGEGIESTYTAYPFFGYGTDWLAYAHLLLALLFYGPYIDPVRNSWLFQFGLIACIGVIPLALVAGAVREIPFAWRLIDCSFGVVCAIPLLWALKLTRKLETLEQQPTSTTLNPIYL